MKWQKLLHHCSGFLSVGEGFLKNTHNKKRITHANVSLIFGECSMLLKMSSGAIGTEGGEVEDI